MHVDEGTGGATRRGFLAGTGIGLAAAAAVALPGRPAGATGTAFADLTDVDWPSFDDGDVPVLNTTSGLIEGRVLPFRNYVYNSTGAQGANRFSSWADLMAVLTHPDNQGGKRVYFERDEVLPTAGMPLAGWDVSDVEFHGNGLPAGQGGFDLTCGEGFLFSSMHIFQAIGITLTSTATTHPICTVPSGQGMVMGLKDAAVLRSADVEFLRVEGATAMTGGSLAIGHGESAYVAGSGELSGHPAVAATGYGFIVCALNFGHCYMKDDAFAGDADSTLLYVIGTTNVEGLTPAHPSFAGTIATGVAETARVALLSDWEPVDVDLLAPADAASGTWTAVQDADAFYGGYASNAATPADGQWLEWDHLLLPGGQWAVTLFAVHHPGGPILDVLVDGTVVGSVDTYAATATATRTAVGTWNQPDGAGGAHLADSLVTVRVEVDGRNGGANDHLAKASRLLFRRVP